jgi:hypothetical protein
MATGLNLVTKYLWQHELRAPARDDRAADGFHGVESLCAKLNLVSLGTCLASFVRDLPPLLVSSSCGDLRQAEQLAPAMTFGFVKSIRGRKIAPDRSTDPEALLNHHYSVLNEACTTSITGITQSCILSLSSQIGTPPSLPAPVVA